MKIRILFAFAIFLVFLILGAGLYVVGGWTIYTISVREIDATEVEIFEHIANPENAEKWMFGVSKVSGTKMEPSKSDDGNYESYRVITESYKPGEDVVTRNEWILINDSPRQFAVAFDDATMSTEDRFEISCKVNKKGVKRVFLRRETACTYRGIYRLVAPLIRHSLRKKLNAEMTSIEDAFKKSANSK